MQESKHRYLREISFAKLKGMLANTRCKFAAALLIAALLGPFHGFAASASTGQSPKAPAKPEESELSHEIRHQLHVLPYYSVFDYISFNLLGDKVTLTGYVLRPTLKNNAEAAVRSIEGVASVSNLIQVLPKSPVDDDLRRAVYRAIFEDSVLQRYAVPEVPSIHIIVNAGSVTLAGTVETEADKNLAASRAAGVPSVSGVTNNLIVRAKNSPVS